MWDQFTGGSVASLNKNKRLKKKAEEALKKKEEDSEKERLKKEQARKLLSIKLRKQAEERRIKAVQRAAMLEQILEEENKIKIVTKSQTSSIEKLSEERDTESAKNQ